jgi:hypothetical protein
MASYNKYQEFVENLLKGVHNFSSDTFKVMLSNTTPNADTHTVRADVTELTTGGGYTSGGATTTVTGVAESAGTSTIATSDVVFTASSGTIGPFRYAILYDDTPTSPADPLIAWWDYGSAITLQDTETFTVNFGASTFTIA